MWKLVFFLIVSVAKHAQPAVTVADAAVEAASALANLYANVKVGSNATNATRELWFKRACPWEETHSSGHFHGAENSDAASKYASEQYYKGGVNTLPASLEKKKVLFVGDSVVRQFAQALLCQWQHIVVLDSPSWIYWPGAPKIPSMSCPTPRHCYLAGAKVLFKGGLEVSYKKTYSCINAGMLEKYLRAGEYDYIIVSQTHHGACNESHWKSLETLPSSPSSKSTTFVLKEYSPQHFPSLRGEYATLNKKETSASVGSARKQCVPLTRDPVSRVVENGVGISIVKRLGWKVLETYADDKKAYLYHASMHLHGSSRLPDCTHWLVPGVPNVWTTKLLNMFSDPSLASLGRVSLS